VGAKRGSQSASGGDRRESHDPKVLASATPPLALGARACAELFGVSVRHWRAMDSAQLVPSPVRLGCAVRWRLDDLRRWLEQGCPGRVPASSK
jgi:predicted DNA-binding transcriptional regulator AlpA